MLVHTQNEMLFSQKKNEMMPFAAIWMDLEIFILSKVSQTEKGKYIITYMQNPKKVYKRICLQN